MVAGGVRDVFVSNEIVAPSKVQRLVALAAQGEAPGMQSCAWEISELCIAEWMAQHAYVACTSPGSRQA